MPSETQKVVLYPELQVPIQFRQCAACFKTEYETSTQMLICSRCRVAHYCVGTICQKNDFPLHKEPCLQRRNAIRRKDRGSPDTKWRPRLRAGGEGAAFVSYDELKEPFMSWSQKNAQILAWAHYQATGMHRATEDGFRKCLHVKLSGRRDTSDDMIQLGVDNIDTVMCIDILRRFEGPFAEVRAKQRTYTEGIYVLAVLLECGPLVQFMPIGTPEELLQTWGDVPEWKEVFKRDVGTI
ncbi:hypothetical protein JB92DRAFT_2983296 [Gautieria morchelliformis]|nr:hypothetical protein JB92DRAFT_2983296 [Gautieria morchelliformis]